MTWTQDHVHFKCSDCEHTVRFFKENFEAKEERGVDSAGALIVTLQIGDAFYKFSPKKPNETVDSSSKPPRYGVYHVAFKTDNLAREVAKMKARGVGFTQDLRQVRPQVQAAFIEGPDGISIELLQHQ